MNFNEFLLLEKNYADISKEYLETVKDKWKNRVIPIMSEEDKQYFTDIHEYDSNETTMYYGKTENPSMFYKWIKVCLMKSFRACKEFFAPGLCQIFVNELLNQNQTALNNVDSEMSEIIEYIVKNEDKSKVGKSFEGISDNITFNDLKNRYENIIDKSNSDRFKNLKDEDIVYEEGHKYEHHLIKSVEELNPFEALITNPDDKWCIFGNDAAFSSYTNNGKYNFHLFVRDDAYELERPYDSKTPADDYGLSCFAVIVKIIEDDETGEKTPAITNCTARYNHSVTGSNDNFLNKDMSKILSITGFKKSIFLEGNVMSLRKIIESCVLELYKTDFVTIKCDNGRKNFIVIDNNTRKLMSKDSIYDHVSYFQDGFAKVKKDNKWSFINAEGKQTGGWYDDVNDFQNGFAKVKKDNKWSFINAEGKQIGGWYAYTHGFYNGFAKVGKEGKWSFINADGKQTGGWYDDVNDFQNGFAEVEKEGKRSFINAEGKQIGGLYDVVFSFRDGLAKVERGGKCTFINTDGKQIGGWYDVAFSFRDGFAEVVQDGETFKIDTNGNRVNESLWYTPIQTVPLFESFYNKKVK